VASVQQQKYDSIDIVVVDNHSEQEQYKLPCIDFFALLLVHTAIFASWCRYCNNCISLSSVIPGGYGFKSRLGCQDIWEVMVFYSNLQTFNLSWENEPGKVANNCPKL
jgi:hypothetical protein